MAHSVSNAIAKKTSHSITEALDGRHFLWEDSSTKKHADAEKKKKIPRS